MKPSDATAMRPDLGPALTRIHQKMAELARAAGQAEADCPELRELEELAKAFAPPTAPGSWVPKFTHIQWGTVASLMGGTGHLEPDMKRVRMRLGWDPDKRICNRELEICDNGGEINLAELVEVPDQNGVPISIPYTAANFMVDEAAMAHRITRYLQGREDEVNWDFHFRR